jgi:hypothetical protein
MTAPGLVVAVPAMRATFEPSAFASRGDAASGRWRQPDTTDQSGHRASTRWNRGDREDRFNGFQAVNPRERARFSWPRRQLTSVPFNALTMTSTLRISVNLPRFQNNV